MIIKSIEVKNFKSLVDFKINLAKFNCLIGLNGSGKSTFLQFMDFLVPLMKGDMKGWLKRRGWKAKELFNDSEEPITFKIEFQHERMQSWSASFSMKSLRCYNEKFQCIPNVNSPDFDLLKTVKGDKKRKYQISLSSEIKQEGPINFIYEGSLLSRLNDKEVIDKFSSFRDDIKKIESFDLLAPQYLRQKARESKGSIGLGGERLSALLSELGEDECSEINTKLKEVYPQLQEIHAKNLRAGWKQLEITENYASHRLTESRHINDGLLRLLAILAQMQTDHQFLLFDEIENGINPELTDFLLRQLTEAEQQIVVTTHSPMLLNYLKDDLVREAVRYFYKTKEGHTHCIPFFEIPSVKKKLGILGPGEAFSDTDLFGLADEIEEITVNKVEV